MKRKFNPEKATKAQLAATLMPALKHSDPTDQFHISKSDVVKWLRDQPAILQAMFNFYKDSGAIIFDKETGLWRGIDFSAP